MRSVNCVLLERLIADGSFNPEHKAENDYSHSMTILLAFIPDTKVKDIERGGNWAGCLLVQWTAGGDILCKSYHIHPQGVEVREGISQADI